MGFPKALYTSFYYFFNLKILLEMSQMAIRFARYNTLKFLIMQINCGFCTMFTVLF